MDSTKSIKFSTGNFKHGRNNIVTYRWVRDVAAEDDKAKAIVFLSHGYAEYIAESYFRTAHHLATKGFVVYGHDHLGHGRCGTGLILCQSLVFLECT